MFKSIAPIIYIACSFCYYWTLHYTISCGNEIQFTWGRQSNTGVDSLKSAFSMVNNGQDSPFYSIPIWCHPMTLHHDIIRVHLLWCILWYTNSVSITYLFWILHSMSHFPFPEVFYVLIADTPSLFPTIIKIRTNDQIMLKYFIC